LLSYEGKQEAETGPGAKKKKRRSQKDSNSKCFPYLEEELGNRLHQKKKRTPGTFLSLLLSSCETEMGTRERKRKREITACIVLKRCFNAPPSFAVRKDTHLREIKAHEKK
jgi:hypothetical protein